jgi:probable HAF family extracellular repeat protein
VTDLGNVVPHDINNRGQVVGAVFNRNTVSGPAFLWENGALTPLGTPPGETTFLDAFSLNNVGQVVGLRRLSPGGTPQAVLYDGGRVTDLPFQSVAAINDAGQVAGSATFAAGPLLYDRGTVTPVPPITSSLTNGQATALNSRGDVVGFMSSGAQFNAFLYSGGRTTDLGALGGRGSRANSLNDRGQVVGKFILPGVVGEHAFLYSDGRMTDLGVLGGIVSEAADINNNGQIVGFSYAPAGLPYDIAGILWQDGTMYDLNNYMLSAPGAITNFRPVAINDSGLIAGYGRVGGDTHGFLLTPVPEPGNMILLSVAGIALGRSRKR